MTRFLLVAAAALATAGCHKVETVPANEAAANITSVDANAMPDDANITDVPADDGDAPTEDVAQPSHTKTTTTMKTVKTETK